MNPIANSYVENTVIFQNPDGSIQLGMQLHLRDKKTNFCTHCKLQMVR